MRRYRFKEWLHDNKIKLIEVAMLSGVNYSKLSRYQNHWERQNASDLKKLNDTFERMGWDKDVIKILSEEF